MTSSNDVIKSMWPDYSTQAISAAVGMSRQQVYKRAVSMGLSTENRHGMRGEHAYALRVEHPGLQWHEIAKRAGYCNATSACRGAQGWAKRHGEAWPLPTANRGRKRLDSPAVRVARNGSDE